MNAVPSSLDARRAAGSETFRALGVPHRRIEEWKYSDLRTALTAEAVAASGSAQWNITGTGEGLEIADLSHTNLPDWVQEHLGKTTARNGMEAASLGFAQSGVALRVTRAIAEPLRLTFSGTGHARLLILLEEGASLTLLESHDTAEGLRNLGSEILLGKNAQLAHIVLTQNAPGLRIGSTIARLARDASYHAHLANFGAQLSRQDVSVTLEGEGGEARLSSVSALGGESHADMTTHVIHAAGHTRSTQLVKQAAGGHARGVYQGRVTVSPGANGSDSLQSAKGLLLGTRAEIDFKPELEIFADDVKCAHGAAVGDLDMDSLFYLRSRGLPEDEARNLLIRAFLEDAVQEIANENLRAEIWQEVEQALRRAMEVQP